jgi:hypothetical protein
MYETTLVLVIILALIMMLVAFSYQNPIIPPAPVIPVPQTPSQIVLVPNVGYQGLGYSGLRGGSGYSPLFGSSYLRRRY